MTLLMPPDIRKEYWALIQRHIDGFRITAAEQAWSLDIMHLYGAIVTEDEIESVRLGRIKHGTDAFETVLFRRLTPRERAGWADPDKRRKSMRRYCRTLPYLEVIEEIGKRMALEKAGRLSNGHPPH